jgi:Uma2 family endonuclease
MTAALKTKLTASEYLAIERQAEFKSEFFNGEMFAMAGASPRHNFIRENLSGELYGRLKGSPCRAVSADQRVHVSRTGLYTYPDLLIVCGPPELDPADDHSIINPVAIVEVLSPSTEKYDRGAKFRNYQQIPSLMEYILVAQDEAVIERFVRQTDGSWGLISFVGLETTLAFTTIPVQIGLREIYAGVSFDTPAL